MHPWSLQWAAGCLDSRGEVMDKDHFLVTKTLDTYHNGACGKACMTHEFIRQMSPYPYDTAAVSCPTYVPERLLFSSS